MYIYGVFEGYIQQYSAVTEVFFIRKKKKSRGNVFAENDKNRDPMHIINIPFVCPVYFCHFLSNQPGLQGGRIIRIYAR